MGASSYGSAPFRLAWTQWTAPLPRCLRLSAFFFWMAPPPFTDTQGHTPRLSMTADSALSARSRAAGTAPSSPRRRRPLHGAARLALAARAAGPEGPRERAVRCCLLSSATFNECLAGESEQPPLVLTTLERGPQGRGGPPAKGGALLRCYLSPSYA